MNTVVRRVWKAGLDGALQIAAYHSGTVDISKYVLPNSKKAMVWRMARTRRKRPAPAGRRFCREGSW